MLFKKTVDADTADNEVELHHIAHKHGIAPRIRRVVKGAEEWEIYMDDLGPNTIAHVYGESADDVPAEIWAKIRRAVRTLYEEEGIVYVDLTPYNVIRTPDARVWLIDFGDAYYANSDAESEWFLEEFLDGRNFWNPDFA